MAQPSSSRPADRAEFNWRHVARPGLGIKRWILLLFVGVTCAGLGFALLLQGLTARPAWPHWLDLLMLRFLPVWLRVLLLLLAGFGLAGYAAWGFYRTVVGALLPTAASPTRAVLQALLQQERRHGPRIVAIGGGTGMPQLLRGLRAYTDNITAIVTVADDGGSSGRLRQQMGLLPPGDFRNNIAALSEAEDLMTRLFQYRFADADVGQAGSGELAGHSFGNLFIATMAAVTGSFEEGISESSRVLAVRGRILPSTLEHVTLCAELSRTTPEGVVEWLSVEGESSVTATEGRIERIYLKPESPRAYPAAVRALLQADLIVASPGSFYTSLLPNLLVPSIRDAIEASRAQRIYVCNVATQAGETDGYSVSDHMAQLRRHAGRAFTVALANDRYDEALPPSAVSQWVTLPAAGEALDYRLFMGNLVDDATPWRHDATKLARRVLEVYQTLAAERSSASPDLTPPARPGGHARAAQS